MSKSKQPVASPEKSKPKNSAGLARAGRFGLVGILNTIIDFVIATLIATAIGATHIWVAFATPEGTFTITGVIIASVIAGFIAMINSYFLNLRFTFRAHSGGGRQALRFFLITGFGLAIIRPLVIKLATDWWSWPVDFGYTVAQIFGLQLSHDMVVTLVGIAAGIIVVWPYNYFMYKRFVFTDRVEA